MGLDRQVVAGAKPHYPLSNAGPVSHDDSLPGGPSADTRSTDSDRAEESKNCTERDSQVASQDDGLCAPCRSGHFENCDMERCATWRSWDREPIVKGGQGHSAEDVEEDGNALIGLTIVGAFGSAALLLYMAGATVNPRIAGIYAVLGVGLQVVGAVAASGDAKGVRR